MEIVVQFFTELLPRRSIMLSLPSLNRAGSEPFFFVATKFLPELLTCFAALSLFCVGMYYLIRQRNPKFFSFSVASLGFSIFAFHSVPGTAELLASGEWRNIVAVVTGAASLHLIHAMALDRHRWFTVGSIALPVFALLPIFGTVLPLPAILRPTPRLLDALPLLILSATFLLVVPTQIRIAIRKSVDFRFLIGFNLAALFTILNCVNDPDLPLQSVGRFLFFPLGIAGYGMFRVDFENYVRLCVKRHALFYGVSFLLSALFLTLSLLAVIYLKPGYGLAAYREPYFVVPLSSFLFLFGYGIYFAGNAPGKRLNMFIAIFLFVTGSSLAVMVFESLQLNPIATREIEQLCFSILAFLPSVSLRFISLILLKKPFSFLYRFFDFFGVIAALLPFSPYFFDGYYDYLFLRGAAAGPGLALFYAIEAVFTATLLILWLLNVAKIHLRKSIATVAILLIHLFLLGGALSSFGYPVYPPGNLQLLPGILLVFAIKSKNKRNAASITGRISLASIVFLPLILITYALAMFDTAPPFQVYMHLLLVASPILLSFYTFTFILTRPIAETIDNSDIILRREHRKAVHLKQIAESERTKSDQILFNTLPSPIVEELKVKGYVEPKHYESASVLFADFAGFTRFAEQITPQDLVYELNYYFDGFDRIVKEHNLEKLKTMGDSYIAAAGIPGNDPHHALHTVDAALAMKEFVAMAARHREARGALPLSVRIGIHSGPLIAGVIGSYKFTYDIWGDTVNTAKRMEEAGVAGEVNLSAATFGLVRETFECLYRGKIVAKNKGDLDMYLVKKRKNALSQTDRAASDTEGIRLENRLNLSNGEAWTN